MSRFLVFPKFLCQRSIDELADGLAQAGLDGIALPVRDGYWTPPGDLSRTLPGVLAALARRRLAVPYAIVGARPAALAADLEPLRILAAHGVAMVRVGYLQAGTDPRAALAAGRRDLAALAAAAGRLGIRAVVQLHQGTLHPSPEAAWSLVEGTDPAALGIKVDPGNQVHEGRSDPRRSIALLGAHLAAVGVKDAAWTEAAGAWSLRWVDPPAGVAGWPAWTDALHEAAFAGPFVLNDFAHEHEPERILPALAGTVRWLRTRLPAHALEATP